MKKVRIVALLILLGAAVAAGLMWLVPIPDDWPYSNALFYWPLALTAALAVTHFGGASLLLMGAGAYKAELRKAYLIICLSIMIGAAGTAQLPAFNALEWWGSFWASTGLFAIPFVLAGLGAYLGVRKLALLIGVRSWLTRAAIAVPAILVICVASALVPHVHTATDELTMDISNIILSWSVFTFLAGVVMMVAVLRHIGAHYARAMAWLACGLTGSFLALGVALVGAYVSNQNPDGWAIASYSCGVAAGLLYIAAGVAFNKTKEY
jgi:hypothetical protein